MIRRPLAIIGAAAARDLRYSFPSRCWRGARRHGGRQDGRGTELRRSCARPSSPSLLQAPSRASSWWKLAAPVLSKIKWSMHRVRSRMLPEDHRRHPRAPEQGGQTEARLHAACSRSGTVREKIASEFARDLDRRDEHRRNIRKIESYHRVAELKKTVAREHSDEEKAIADSRLVTLTLEGRRFSRRNAEQAPSSGWARL